MPVKVITADEEYKKYKDLRKEDVEVLQQWVAKQPHLPLLTELQIVWFFHSCYFKIEPTKKTIENYFALKSSWPELFAGRDPNLPLCKQAMNTCLVTALPQLTPEGNLVLFAAIVDRDPSKFNIVSYCKLIDMVGELLWLETGTVNGVVLILDSKNFTLGHLPTLSISFLKKMFFYAQEAMPARLRSCHYINSGQIVDKAMILLKPFMKKSFIDMLHIHAQANGDLFRFVPKECLPSDYGGNAPSMADLQVAMKKKLLDGADYLIQTEKIIASGSKKSVSCNWLSEACGVDGSFKKLEID